MDSSEKDDPQVEPIDPHRPEFIDLAEEPSSLAPLGASEPESLPAPMPAEATPLEPAEPGKYWCEIPGGGGISQIGGIMEGENDFSHLCNPNDLLTLAALVRGGTLEKMDDSASKDAKGSMH